MNMVWHQAISVEIERKFGFLVLEQAREPEVVIVGPEDLSTIIPASDYVIEPPRFRSRFPLGMAKECYRPNCAGVNKDENLLSLV